MTSHPAEPDESDESGDSRSSDAVKRRQRIIAVCIAAITAAVAAVVIVAITAGGGSDDTGSPAAAATAYGKALLARNSGALKSITCSSHSHSSDDVYLLTFAGTPVPSGHDRWDVSLTSTGPGGGTRINVNLERSAGKYLVC